MVGQHDPESPSNPQFKTLNIYDSSMKKVYQEHEKKENKPEQGQEVAPDRKEEKKKEVSKEPDEESPNKGKRTFTKKGLGV